MNQESPPDQAQKAPIPWRIYGLIGIVALLIALTMGYLLRTGNRMTARHTPLIDAAMEIKLEATTAHLWLEEIISGDPYVDTATVWRHLNAAEWYANAMLEGGENPEGTFIPLEDPQLRYEITEVQRLLRDFKELAEERFFAQEGVGPGTDVDQRFDTIFADFLQHADEVETRLQQLIRADLRWFHRVQVILIFITLGLAVITGFVLHRFERRRAASYLAAEEAEHSARVSEERLQLVFKESDLGLWDWNIQTGEVHFNESWVEMLGYALDEIEPHIDTWMKLVHPDDLQHVEQVLNAHLEGKTPYYETEHRMRAKSGEWKWVLDRGRVFTRDEAGKPVRAVGTHLDITERHQAEEALQESEARLKAIVETATSGIIVIDRNGIVEDFNHGAGVIFGYNSSDVIGQNVKMLMPEAYASEHDGYLNNYHETGNKKIIGIGREVEGRKKDGSTFPMHLSVNEVQLSNRTVYAGIIDDTTERVKAEAKLQEYAQQLEWTNIEISDALKEAELATQAKSGFLASMSHELRTPLNSIIGFANVLKKNKAQNLNAKDLKYLDRLSVNATDLLTLINDILDISKIEAGELALEEAAIDLGELIHETVDQLKGHGKAGETQIIVELPEEVAPLHTDRTRLKQVLVNLLGNALKFTEKGTVTVALEINSNDRSVTKISVRDTGIGIPADRLQMIFEAFQQADNSIARKYGGTGLGLAISLRICRAMGCDLLVESEEGVGSTFTIAFQTDGE